MAQSGENRRVDPGRGQDGSFVWRRFLESFRCDAHGRSYVFQGSRSGISFTFYYQRHVRFADPGASGDLDLFQAETANPLADIERRRRAPGAATGTIGRYSCIASHPICIAYPPFFVHFLSAKKRLTNGLCQ
jgi:hypothetical protein